MQYRWFLIHGDVPIETLQVRSGFYIVFKDRMLSLKNIIYWQLDWQYLDINFFLVFQALIWIKQNPELKICFEWVFKSAVVITEVINFNREITPKKFVTEQFSVEVFWFRL